MCMRFWSRTVSVTTFITHQSRRKRWSLFGRKDETRRELTIPVGKKEAPELQEGPARLLLT